jgi:hypothetical protein
MKPSKEIRELMHPVIRQLFPIFSELTIGDQFMVNGNVYLKVSTRTAKIVKPAEYNNRWFYFGKNDKVLKI